MSPRIASPELNVMAEAFYKDSQELHSLIEKTRAMPSARSVDRSERVDVFKSSDTDITDRLFNMIS